MPRYATHNGTTQRRTPPESRRVSAAGRTSRAGRPFFSPSRSPHCRSWRSSRPRWQLQPSAPHQSAPHPSSPPAHAPQPAYRPPQPGPAYPEPTYHGAPPGSAPPLSNRHMVAPTPGANTHYPYPTVRGPYSAPGNAGGPHLGNWLQSHQGQSFAGQENALRREPGFNSLPPAAAAAPHRPAPSAGHHAPAAAAAHPRPHREHGAPQTGPPSGRAQLRAGAQQHGPGRQQQVRGAFRVLREMPPASARRCSTRPPIAPCTAITSARCSATCSRSSPTLLGN